MNRQIVRSALFVPATRPERIPKALASGADRVIVDLEDAVEEGLKVEARANLRRFLVDTPEARVLVRINAAEHPGHADDLALWSGTVLDRRIDAVQRRRQACQARLQEQCVTGVTENLFGCVAAAVEIEVQGQVEPIHQTLMPSPAELEWARRVAEAGASGAGVFVVDGEMVDAPVLGRARRLLERAGEGG